MMDHACCSILVVGIGNRAMGDDGIGPRLIEELRRRPLPSEIRLLRVDADPTRILLETENAEQVYFLDAVCSDSPPGTLHRLSVSDLLARPSVASSSLHQFGLRQVLELARALGQDFDAMLLGVESGEIGPGHSLTERLSNELPRIADQVEREILDAWRGLCVRTAE